MRNQDLHFPAIPWAGNHLLWRWSETGGTLLREAEEERSCESMRGWFLTMVMLAAGILLFWESVRSVSAQGLLFLWCLVLVAVLYFRPDPR